MSSEPTVRRTADADCVKPVTRWGGLRIRRGWTPNLAADFREGPRPSSHRVDAHRISGPPANERVPTT